MSSSTSSEYIIFIANQSVIIIGFIIMCFGIIGNSINIIFFNSVRLFRQNQCAFYFTVESIMNLVQILINLSTRILMDGFVIDHTRVSVVWCKMRALLAQALSLIPLYIVCLEAFDQYLSTNHNNSVRKKSTLSLARYLCLSVIILFFLHGIPFVILFNLEASNKCEIANKIFDHYYALFHYPFLHGIIPMFLAALFGTLAYRNVRRIVRRQIAIVRRRLDRQLTAMVLARALVLVILIAPYTVYRIYVLNIHLQADQTMLAAINTLLNSITILIFYSNYSGSFYIFLAASSRFRRQLKHILMKKYILSLKSWCCQNKRRVTPGTMSPSDTFELD